MQLARGVINVIGFFTIFWVVDGSRRLSFVATDSPLPKSVLDRPDIDGPTVVFFGPQYGFRRDTRRLSDGRTALAISERGKKRRAPGGPRWYCATLGWRRTEEEITKCVEMLFRNQGFAG